MIATTIGGRTGNVADNIYIECEKGFCGSEGSIQVATIGVKCKYLSRRIKRLDMIMIKDKL